MKKDIHPPYYSDAVVKCACGNSFTIGSTVKEIIIEICSACHPFYTGKQKLVDTAHRIDRFRRIQEKHQELKKIKRRKVKDSSNKKSISKTKSKKG